MTAKVSKKNSFSTLSYQVLWLGSGIRLPRTIPLGPLFLVSCAKIIIFCELYVRKEIFFIEKFKGIKVDALIGKTFIQFVHIVAYSKINNRFLNSCIINNRPKILRILQMLMINNQKLIFNNQIVIFFLTPRVNN